MATIADIAALEAYDRRPGMFGLDWKDEEVKKRKENACYRQREQIGQNLQNKRV